MIYINGLSHTQAAEQLELTDAASRKTLSRALAKLSRILA